MTIIIRSFWYLLAAAPFVCLALLVKSRRSGKPLPGRFGTILIFTGCLTWYPFIFEAGALNQSLKPLILLPGFFGAALCLAWEWRYFQGKPPSGTWTGAAVYAGFGLLLYIAVGGGYFDRVFQIAHARSLIQSRVPLLRQFERLDHARRDGVLKELGRALNDTEVYIRWGAAMEMGFLGSRAKPAVTALVPALDDKDDRVRRAVLSALKALGRDAGPAAPAIAGLLRDDAMAWEAEQLFAGLGDGSVNAAPELILMLREETPRIRARALRALGVIGPSAKEAAIPAMVPLIQVRNREVGDALADAIKKMQISPGEWQDAVGRYRNAGYY
ncbi:MAG: HEAT repeat domain-containing protein [bacterium]